MKRFSLAMALAVGLLGGALVSNAQAARIDYDVNLLCVTGCASGTSFTGTFSYDTEDMVRLPAMPMSGGMASFFASIDTFMFDIMGVTFDQTDLVQFAGVGFDADRDFKSFSIEVFDVVAGVSINLLATNNQIWQAGGTTLGAMSGTSSAIRRTISSAIPEPQAALVFGVGLGLLGFDRRRQR